MIGRAWLQPTNTGAGHAPDHLHCRTDCRHSCDSFLLRPSLRSRMTMIEDERVYPENPAAPRYLGWSPAVAGALIATALSTVLIAFGTAIGLGVASAAPTWRDASVALWLLSGLYLIMVALVSFGVGGYFAGRIRTGL